MLKVELDLGPPLQGYHTFEEACAASMSDPRQETAQEDTARLAGTIFEGGGVGSSICTMAFSNGLFLIASAKDFHIHWELSQTLPPIDCVLPREFVFSDTIACPFDPNPILAEFAGSKFWQLFAWGRSLLVYTRGNKILNLSAYREKSTGRDILYLGFQE